MSRKNLPPIFASLLAAAAARADEVMHNRCAEAIDAVRERLVDDEAEMLDMLFDHEACPVETFDGLSAGVASFQAGKDVIRTSPSYTHTIAASIGFNASANGQLPKHAQDAIIKMKRILVPMAALVHQYHEYAEKDIQDAEAHVVRVFHL